MLGKKIYSRHKLRLLEFFIQNVWWCEILWGFGDVRIELVAVVMDVFFLSFWFGCVSL